MSDLNYSFAASVIGIRDADQLLLPTGAVLRPATLEEAMDISRNIDYWVGEAKSSIVKMNWQNSDGLRMFKLNPPPCEYNFFVIDGLKDEKRRISQAFDLSPVELEIGLTRTPVSTGLPDQFFRSSLFRI